MPPMNRVAIGAMPRSMVVRPQVGCSALVPFEEPLPKACCIAFPDPAWAISIKTSMMTIYTDLCCLMMMRIYLNSADQCVKRGVLSVPQRIGQAHSRVEVEASV